jgi:hypothetical protein
MYREITYDLFQECSTAVLCTARSFSQPYLHVISIPLGNSQWRTLKS